MQGPCWCESSGQRDHLLLWRSGLKSCWGFYSIWKEWIKTKKRSGMAHLKNKHIPEPLGIKRSMWSHSILTARVRILLRVLWTKKESGNGTFKKQTLMLATCPNIAWTFGARFGQLCKTKAKVSVAWFNSQQKMFWICSHNFGSFN